MKKSANVEMSSEEGHSLRGDTGLARAKDSSQAKKVMTISPLRRKRIAKPEKPRWQTAISVLTKNLVLVLVLLGLWNMISKQVWKFEDSSVVAPVATLDFEGRISELEAFLKKTTNMMQVQVDVVDRKIESEVASLRGEVTKKVEEKGLRIETEFKKLGFRTDNLEKSLHELKDTGFLSKEDFNELKMSKGLEGSDERFSLDETRVVAREIVEKEIERHAADGLGRVDYALASSGAKVVRHSEPFYFEKGFSWFRPAKIQNWVHLAAQKMLQPSFGEPGQCFPLKGSNGFVEIKLRTAIIPEALTLDHVSKDLSTGKTIGSGHEVAGLYRLDCSSSPTVLYGSVDAFQLHCRLGHPSLQRLRQTSLVPASIFSFVVLHMIGRVHRKIVESPLGSKGTVTIHLAKQNRCLSWWSSCMILRRAMHRPSMSSRLTRAL
ncbi:SUN domain-containing protein 1-like isoform X3 [Tasmannia lanceolata]